MLEFGRDGVKDAFNQYESKRSFEKFLAQMIAGLDDIKMKNCTLAQGRRLLLDALAINKQYGTTPHKDYRLNLSLINQLIIEASDLDEDDELLFDEGHHAFSDGCKLFCRHVVVRMLVGETERIILLINIFH